ncbi:MAG TPA: 4-(cytidine 5'-diphospho)-2-C-methyl-D-erythritol kinase [Trichormus sp.]|jgi:4-diphosphocytidyl-2-C-methyl-D-erythritol kinase
MNEPFRTIKVRSPAKINLTFAITGTLPNGFHEVETLMQTIDLEDELTFTIEPSDAPSVKLTCEGSIKPIDFPLNESNLIVKSAQLFMSVMGGALSIRVKVKKNIPIAAGMAGGSSNGASTLVALNHYVNQRFTQAELEAMASHLGSDVPFCIVGGTQIGRNRGDELAEVRFARKMHFTIVKVREFAIATPWIYKQYDEFIAQGGMPRPVSIRDAIAAVQNNRAELADKNFINVFEPIVYEHYPELKEIRSHLFKLGADACFMTGSGPTLVALSDSISTAETLRHQILVAAAERRSLWNSSRKLSLDVWTAESLEHGAKIVDVAPDSVPT